MYFESDHIGAVLKAYRIKNKVTQEFISDHFGFSSQQYVSNVERGLCKPSLKYLKEWCEMIGADKRKVKNTMVKSYEDKVSEALCL